MCKIKQSPGHGDSMAKTPAAQARPESEVKGLGHYIARAYADGMTRVVVAGQGVWSCSICPKSNIEEIGNLKSHLNSSKHTNSMEWAEIHRKLRALYAEGKHPPWLELLDWGNDVREHCKLCKAVATEGHLASATHTWRVWDHDHNPGGYFASITAPHTAASALVPFQQRAPPAAWGDPSHFEYEPEKDGFRCLLCWKFTTEEHIKSDKHIWRALNPQDYLWPSSGISATSSSRNPTPTTAPPLGYVGQPPPPRGPANVPALTMGSSQPRQEMLSPDSFLPGDWRCPGCRDHQFGQNSKCQKCSMPKPAAAAASATQPRLATQPTVVAAMPNGGSAPTVPTGWRQVLLVLYCTQPQLIRVRDIF